MRWRYIQSYLSIFRWGLIGNLTVNVASAQIVLFGSGFEVHGQFSVGAMQCQTIMANKNADLWAVFGFCQEADCVATGECVYASGSVKYEIIFPGFAISGGFEYLPIAALFAGFSDHERCGSAFVLAHAFKTTDYFAQIARLDRSRLQFGLVGVDAISKVWSVAYLINTLNFNPHDQVFFGAIFRWKKDGNDCVAFDAGFSLDKLGFFFQLMFGYIDFSKRAAGDVGMAFVNAEVRAALPLIWQFPVIYGFDQRLVLTPACLVCASEYERLAILLWLCEIAMMGLENIDDFVEFFTIRFFQTHPGTLPDSMCRRLTAWPWRRRSSGRRNSSRCTHHAQRNRQVRT